MSLLTVKEVAEKLGVSAPTVMRLADTGKLSSIEVAKRAGRRFLRFRPEEVEQFILAHETKAGGAVNVKS